MSERSDRSDRSGRAAGLVLLGLAWLAAGCAASGAGQRGELAVGDFCLRELGGERVCLSDHAGKVVLVAFWATWCDPCQIELRQLQAIWQRHRDRGFALLTVSVDTADKHAEVRRLVRRYRYRFPVLLDASSELTDRFHPTMEMPFNMLLDHRGRIIARQQGYRPGDELRIEREIEAALAALPES